MSDYRREQLLTYIGGPFLVLVSAALAGLLGANAVGALGASKLLGGAMIATGLLVSFGLALYGAYTIHEGRRVLASDHWRAEHFQA